MPEKSGMIKIIDKLIFVFVIIFLASLHNSIFVNQVGYFGALLLIVIKSFISRKNQFKKTGFEWIFLLFFFAEFLSAVFSDYSSLAFHNLLKRILLIPIVYVILSAADDMKKAKLFFKIYAGAAILTIILYIIFAYEHFIGQFYQLEGKGPSPFQYVMTAGGLISILVVFLFAFLLNEKTSPKNKLFLFAAFSISSIALAASYTRAAWIGAAAGIFFILLLKRKWFIIIPVILFAAGFILIQKNTSDVFIYSWNGESLIKENQIHFEGKLNSVIPENDQLYAAAHEKGVFDLIKSKNTPIISTASPVEYFLRWTDNYFLAYLVDRRICVYKKSEDAKFKFTSEFVSAGINNAFELANGFLYMADHDSGLTIFTNPENPKEFKRYPGIKKMRRIAVNSKNLCLLTDDDDLYVYNLQNGILTEKIYQGKINTKYGFMSLHNSYFIISTEENLNLFRIDSNEVKEIYSDSRFKQINSFSIAGEKIFATDFSGNFYELQIIDDKITLINSEKLDFAPLFVYQENHKFYITKVKISRINSIVDPYHFSNLQRLYQWQAGLKILKNNPVFGVGDIDMDPVYKQYRNYYERESFGHLHNNYIHLLAALGLFGFTIVMIMLIKIFMIHLKIYKAVKNEKFISSVSLGAAAAFISFLVSGLAEWNFGDHEIITMIWFILGLNLTFYKNYLSTEREKNTEYFNVVEK